MVVERLLQTAVQAVVAARLLELAFLGKVLLAGLALIPAVAVAAVLEASVPLVQQLRMVWAAPAFYQPSRGNEIFTLAAAAVGVKVKG